MSKILLEDYADFLVEIAPEVKEVLEATFQDAARVKFLSHDLINT
jgi:hypothetical protein